LTALVAATLISVAYGLQRSRTAANEKELRIAADLEREIAQKVSDFLVDDFLSEAMPERKLGRRVTVEELLDRAALKIGKSSVGNPEIDARIHSVIGNAYRKLGVYDKAESHLKKALEIRSRNTRSERRSTFQSRRDLAITYQAMGYLGEAEAILRQNLDNQKNDSMINKNDLFNIYDNLATVIFERGKWIEAETLARETLNQRLGVLGGDHLDTAGSYDTLATILVAEGRHLEGELSIRRALDIRLKYLAENHPDTATSYDNLASNLDAQGKYAEAELQYKKALAIRLKVLGTEHPDTATSYGNLASNLDAQGKYAEAEAMHRHALAIQLIALGEGHPDTAKSYNNLALVFRARGRLAEAEAMHRRALAIRLKAVGEAHPDTAASYDNLANVLRGEGRLPEAEAMHRLALAIYLKAVGKGHADTGNTYYNLGLTLGQLGKTDEALDALTAAVDTHDRARLRGATGLEASLRAQEDPSPVLAVALARAGRGREAWQRWERGLARGVLDEAAGRAARPLTPDERARDGDLLRHSQAVDERASRLAGQARLTADDEKRLDNLRREASDLRRQLLELQQALGQKYGPLAGNPVTLDEAQVALADDTALVGWVDAGFRHAACVLRRSGDPAWVTTPGAGQDGDWTEDEETLARRLRVALAARAPADNWRPQAEALAKQRLGPVEVHLKGVRRIVVVNSPGLAGLPVEVLFAVRGGLKEPGPVVAYAPSASMFVHLARAARPAGRPATLLALGDPAYPASKPNDEKATMPPDHGLLVVSVVPNGNADLFGIRPGDVLLEYDGTTLKTRDDLKVVAAVAGPRQVALRLWRAGEERTVEVAAGALGVQLDPRPAAPVVLPQRAATEVLAPTRGGSWARLPGSRREVAAIAGLFPAEGVTMLLGDEARE
jgi:tetratricopeptide (TPR) repeat protein